MPTGTACTRQPQPPVGSPAVFSHISPPVDASLGSLSAGAWPERTSTHVSVSSHASSAACDCPRRRMCSSRRPATPTPGCIYSDVYKRCPFYRLYCCRDETFIKVTDVVAPLGSVRLRHCVTPGGWAPAGISRYGQGRAGSGRCPQVPAGTGRAGQVSGAGRRCGPLQARDGQQPRARSAGRGRQPLACRLTAPPAPPEAPQHGPGPGDRSVTAQFSVPQALSPARRKQAGLIWLCRELGTSRVRPGERGLRCLAKRPLLTRKIVFQGSN